MILFESLQNYVDNKLFESLSSNKILNFIKTAKTNPNVDVHARLGSIFVDPENVLKIDRISDENVEIFNNYDDVIRYYESIKNNKGALLVLTNKGLNSYYLSDIPKKRYEFKPTLVGDALYAVVIGDENSIVPFKLRDVNRDKYDKEYNWSDKTNSHEFDMRKNYNNLSPEKRKSEDEFVQKRFGVKDKKTAISNKFGK